MRPAKWRVCLFTPQVQLETSSCREIRAKRERTLALREPIRSLDMLDKPSRAALLDEIAAITGARYVLTEASDQAAYLTEMRNMFHGRALAVVRPGTTAEVAKLLALASRSRTPVVPQGGNTGLVGGQVPDASGDAIILSLTRLDRGAGKSMPCLNTMTVEAGLTLPQGPGSGRGGQSPLSAVARFGRYCTIGGNLSTNAGGRRGARLRQRPRSRARPRGRARRWSRDERSLQAAQGQHRL